MEGQIRGKARRACDGYGDDGKRMVLNRGTATLWLLLPPDKLPETRRGKEAASLPPLQFCQHHFPAAARNQNGASILVGGAVAGTYAQALYKKGRN